LWYQSPCYALIVRVGGPSHSKQTPINLSYERNALSKHDAKGLLSTARRFLESPLSTGSQSPASVTGLDRSHSLLLVLPFLPYKTRIAHIRATKYCLLVRWFSHRVVVRVALIDPIAAVCLSELLKRSIAFDNMLLKRWHDHLSYICIHIRILTRNEEGSACLETGALLSGRSALFSLC